jgi:carbon storage regulator
MLVLSRKLNESIVIDGNIRVMVVGFRGNQVRLGIEAPGSVPIYREELLVGETSSDRDHHQSRASGTAAVATV